MKKIFGFLGVAMLMSLAGCSNDDFLDGTQAGGGSEVGTKGDLFMTMNVSMASAIGTRTQTPNQGYEIGQEYENKISSALIILAEGNDTDGYTIKFTSGSIGSTGIVGNPSQNGAGQDHTPNDGTIEPNPSHANTYKASFTFNRETLNEALTEDATADSSTYPGATKKKTFTIFVVANPTQAIIDAAEESADIQQLLAAMDNTYNAESNQGYWKKNNFLMSSAVPMTHTIYDSQIKEGLCTTKDDALDLGTVKVQRAMSRFDLAVDNVNTTFDGTGGDNSTQSALPTSNIKVEFDAVAMINMAKTAYLFKTMALNTAGLKTNDTATKPSVKQPFGWGDERETSFANYWTFTPNQNNVYYNQLFSNQAGSGSSFTAGEYDDFADFFPASGGDWQSIATIKSSIEDNTFEHPNHDQPGNIGNYRIWRYAMENTNPDNVDYQVNGTSTGVIFRAILTDTKETEGYTKVIPTTYAADDNEHKGETIYAYNNVILGTAQQLFDYATRPQAVDDNTGIYPDVNTIIWSLIQPKYDANKSTTENPDKGGWKQVGDNDWWIEVKDETTGQAPEGGTAGGTKTTVYHHGNLSEVFTATDLVRQGFSIYEPTEVDGVPVYYCYYLYWNRHNDNELPTQMGIMEFANVRNNVYKLRVTAVKRLGHPGEPGNDPYPPTPGTPDEEDTFWLKVECKILPWEVRVNNIEF